MKSHMDGLDPRRYVVQVAKLLCEYVLSQSKQEEPVVRLVSPSQLQLAFKEAGIPLNLAAGQAPAAATDLIAAIKLALKYSVRTAHPLFLNQLYARPDPISIAADWLTTALNTNVHTFEVAPVLTTVEVSSCGC